VARPRWECHPCRVPGVSRVHGVLMGIERIAQGELNLAFRLSQCHAFGVLGRSQQGDDGSVLGVAGGVALERWPAA